MTFSIFPDVNFSLGGSRDIFKINGGARINGDIYIPFAPIIHARVAIDCNLLPTQVDTRLNMLSFGAGVGTNFFLIPKLNLRISGIWYWRIRDRIV